MKARPVQIVQWHVRLHSLLPDASLCLLGPELAARMEQIFARLSTAAHFEVRVCTGSVCRLGLVPASPSSYHFSDSNIS